MEHIEKVNENDFMKVLVNTITSCRLVGAVALPFIYSNLGIDKAAICTLVLFATDALDGFLARKLNVSTFLGSLLDASCDKLLITISFILLAVNFPVMWAPLILELTILATNYAIYKKGGTVLVSKIGRNKMILLSFFTIISYLLLALPILEFYNLEKHLPNIINILGGVISGASLLTLIDYFKKFKSIKSVKNDCVADEIKKLKTVREVLKDMVSHQYYIEHKTEPVIKQLYK